MRSWRRAVIAVASLSTLAFPGIAPARLAAETRDAAHVFFSSGCGDCVVYLDRDLRPALIAGGWQGGIETHDYLRPEGRSLLSRMAGKIGLSDQIRSSLYVFLERDEGTLVMLGHVPGPLVEAMLAIEDWPPHLLVSQPLMMGDASTYAIGDFQGALLEFPIETPLDVALDRWQASPPPNQTQASASLMNLVPLVAVAGLMDGVNPCALAVILLLIAFLYTVRRARHEIFALGGAYILAVYAAYFLIGLGLLQAVVVSSDPHLLAKLAALLLIGLGGLNLVGVIRPDFPIQVHMPAFARRRIHALVKKGSFPATLGMGFVVGLCTFPCSGGVYVSIVTLLAAKATAVWGVAMLSFYNLMYVVPLVAILAATGNRVTAKAWAQWERTHTTAIHLAYGAALIGLGIFVLFWAI